jgi:hypothetical protein
LFPFALSPFFFFPGIAATHCLMVAQLLPSPHPEALSWENPLNCACAVCLHNTVTRIEKNGGRPIRSSGSSGWPYHEKTRF